MSILNIAYSSLNAFQRALQVTGNNIANATTKGYSRQTIQFSSSGSNRYAGSFMGNGVSVSSVTRYSDQFASAQMRGAFSTASQYDAFYQQAIQIDKLLAQEGGGISGSMQSFFNSLGQLNSNPGSISDRGVALRESQLLVQNFKSLQSRLDESQHNSTQQISQAVNQINTLTSNLAEVNYQLMGNANAPELLDQKDEILRQLAQYSDLSMTTQDNGTVTVSLASGEMLVSGTTRQELSVHAALDGNTGTRIFINNGAGQVDITSHCSSGSVGGLLAYENNILAKASQTIGKLAIGLSLQFNAQHKLGVDMNDQLGKNFFTDFNSSMMQLQRVNPVASNTGTGVIGVEISDISQIQLSDYELVVSDTATNEVRLIRKSDGTSSILHWSSTPPAPPAGQLVIDGMTIKVDDISHLANQDRFNLAPTSKAAQSFGMEITTAREIALASSVVTSSALTNTGQGQLNLGTVFNTAAVAKHYRLEFISDTQYTLVNLTDSTSSGPFTIVPNSDNTIMIPDSSNPSYSVVLSGIPKAGDQFTANYNTGAVGDNRNGVFLAAIQQSKMFAGGSESLFDSYANLLSDIGSETNQAKNSFDSAEILYKQAADFQESKSGVNLDEEAANLLKFKQAYEAAGKLMEISNQVMSIIFNMMR